MNNKPTQRPEKNPRREEEPLPGKNPQQRPGQPSPNQNPTRKPYQQ